MTLQEAKDKIALSEGHADWLTLRYRENSTSIELLWEQAAELYAASQRTVSPSELAYIESLKADRANAIELQENEISEEYNRGREYALDYAIEMYEAHGQRTVSPEPERIKCKCPCHSYKSVKHVQPCCENGYIELPRTVSPEPLKETWGGKRGSLGAENMKRAKSQNLTNGSKPIKPISHERC